MSTFSFPADDYDPRPLAAKIRDPTGVVLLHDADSEKAHLALAAFEEELFPPGTPANDLYQVFNDWSWEGILLAVAVFPAASLPRLAEVVRGHGLFLLDGTPKTSIGERVSAYDAKARALDVLGVRLSGVSVVCGSPDFFVPTMVSTV